MNAHVNVRNIFGSKSGGGGGGKKGGGSSDAKNTLQSKARARLVEVYSEGPCEGLVDGLKSIYFDQTAVTAPNGEQNMKGITFEERKGTPDQTHVTGSPYVETPEQVEAQVTFNNGPIVRTIVEENADAVRVIVRIPSLFRQTDEGMKTNSVSYAVDVRPFDGAWTEKVVNKIEKEKTISAYQIAHRIDLPINGSPWDIRVRRITPDSDDEKIQNETWFDSYVVLVEGKFTYPNSAFVFMDIDAELFGSSIPARSYHVRGLKVNVPSNYDPITRTYAGVWNGTFKIAWTSNPAWVFYDLLINDRYGLGEFIDPNGIDKWGLYQIARYCDENVFSGYKTAQGVKIMGPRYQFNGVINSRKEAFEVLRDVAATFRGMSFWNVNQIFAVADLPSDPQKLVSPANVINGDFTYSGTAISARHSVAIVNWNDPNDFYRPATEVVINDEMLKKYGWKETKYQATGCTNRGQAHRIGRWILDVEQNETETVNYECSFDHIDVRPFDIIAIADPRKAAYRNGGRLAGVDISGTKITFDAPFQFIAGETHYLSAVLPDGNVVTKQVGAWTEVTDGHALGATLTTPFSPLPIVGAMWAIASASARPRQYRVLNIEESDKNKFKITALFHDPNKYARVEDETLLEPIRYTRPPNSIKAPTNLKAQQSRSYENGAPKNRILFGWTPADDFMATRYRVYASTPDGKIDFGETAQTSIDVDNVVDGLYIFAVEALGYNGLRSQPAVLEFHAEGFGASEMPSIENLVLANGVSGTFPGSRVELTWDNKFPGSTAANNPFFLRNNVKVYDATKTPEALLRNEVVLVPSYTYDIDKNMADTSALGRIPARRLRFEVTVSDVFERTSLPKTITVENPAPGVAVVQVQAGFAQIYVSWQPNFDLDYAGTAVWLEKNSGYNPQETEPKFSGRGGAYVFKTDETVPFYVRVGHYDSFSRIPENVSSEFMITPLSLDLDTEPPAVPSGLTLTSRVDTVEGVAQRVLLQATWNAAEEKDFAYYDVRIREGQGNYVSMTTAENRYEWSVKPETEYTVTVRGVDMLGNQSTYAGTATHKTIECDEIADLINGGSTSINPGKIRISGNTYLSDWRKGGDETRIDGGELSANTVRANTLEIGLRNLVFEGLTFEHNKPAANQVSWTSGVIRYPGDDGNIASRTVVAGIATWTSGSLYLIWLKGATEITTTTVVATAYASNAVVLAVYRGNTDLVTDAGKTIIDGSNIKTGTIDAQQIKAKAIKSDLIDAGAINTGHLQSGSITAETLAVGTGGNWLDNSDMSAGLANWVKIDGTGGVASVLSIRTDTYAPVGGALEVVVANGVTDSTYYTDVYAANVDGSIRDFPVEPGQKYEFSVYALNHRSTAQIYMQFKDADNNHIAYAASSVFPSDDINPLKNLANYKRVFVIATAPAGAVRMTVRLRKGATLTSTSSYMWMTRAKLAKAEVNQTGPSPWAVGGSTKIGAGHIETSSLSAISANLGAITAGSLNINNRFIVDGAGNTTIRSATSGARLEMTSSYILMVDGT
ncbi:TipJ family phage tail tip protein [Phyllobacterium myrsinacearum]|uniref:Putative phage tail protein n=1 Tax=Phyllobacterium myrsinacearum TaxID=28101 RepID=A0A839EWQ5_9HYPH|nr:phage tail protein [Phyllobacterium myrsinacearum]MBA8881736.1 putative phage tail protein [Phyllobacterium myrsinacearum]